MVVDHREVREAVNEEQLFSIHHFLLMGVERRWRRVLQMLNCHLSASCPLNRNPRLDQFDF